MKDQPRNIEFQSFFSSVHNYPASMFSCSIYTIILKYNKYGEISRHQKLLLLWMIYRPDWLCSGKNNTRHKNVDNLETNKPTKN